MKLLSSIIIICISAISYAQKQVPSIYSNIHYNKDGKLYYEDQEKKYYEQIYNSFLTLENIQGNPQGTEKGISFSFGTDFLKGKLYYGLINYSDSKHPMPVWFKKTEKINGGKAEINIQKRLSGIYDMSGWEKSGYGTLGYRVSNKKGELLYDGIISFEKTKTGFKIIPTITEGPFINLLTENSVTISFETNFKIKTSISVGGKLFTDIKECKHHEILISKLKPSTEYSYKIKYGNLFQEYKFKTAPNKGTRKPFVFAYSSDSRAGSGGGEHNLYGTNMYIMKKISALANYKDVAFMQFTGDFINGYAINKGDIMLQYANWKRSVQAFGGYFPIIVAPGNHEAIGKVFINKKGESKAFIDGFPFETESAAAIFEKEFVNPQNGPVSEDGAYYDPNPNKINFPPYDETVFYYTYDNVAMIVLNSDYWYAPSLSENNKTGGNLHAYLMDEQIKWLEKTVKMFEKDKDIDHIFISQHSPAFPNGGHIEDAMWYKGDNKYRPYVAGKPVKKGIIERRDEYLDILINKSTKVVAMLTGDEHNYNKVKISPDVNIYPENYNFKKIKRNRTIWQINNGAAGAPYYAQEKNVPWTKATSGFTTQNALVFIYVDGKNVRVEVINPDTLELIEEYVLKN